MAKKKKATKKTPRKKSVQKKKEEVVEKSTQFTLRLKPEVHDKLKEVSDRIQVSMNQLVQGFCEAAIETAQVGEAVKGEKGKIKLRQTPGCVCFGNFGEYQYRYKGEVVSECDLVEEMGFAYEKHPGVDEVGMDADLWFGLDFSGRAYRRY